MSTKSYNAWNDPTIFVPPFCVKFSKVSSYATNIPVGHVNHSLHLFLFLIQGDKDKKKVVFYDRMIIFMVLFFVWLLC